MARQPSPVRMAKEEDLDDDKTALSGAEHEDNSDPPSPGADDDGQPGGAGVPLQKRRRVTRACDECRRKKIKCDGKQPCTHCTVYSYDCTYDQPSNRRRNPVPAYVEALEARVQRAEGLIQMIAPNLDLNDPALDIAIRHGYIPGLRSGLPNAPPGASIHTQPPRPPPTNGGAAQVKADEDLESMIRAVSEFELDERGHWDYHGHSSGLSFVRRMRERLGDILGPDTISTPFVKNSIISSTLDSPRSNSVGSPEDAGNADLPSEKVAREYCGHTISQLSVLIRPIHLPTFWKSFERIFTQSHDNFTTDDHKFMPLLFSMLAVGAIYAPPDSPSYESAIEKGSIYFRAARHLIDLADIRDINALQAMIFLILFLQSSAKLTQCYSYIGAGMRGAVRMGLHRSIQGKTFDPVETEVRKRLFWSIRKMDIYMGAFLGLPTSLSDDDIDQDEPADTEDDHITVDGIKPLPPGKVTMMTAFNHHTKLLATLSKTVKNIYPIRPKGSTTGPAKSYTVPFAMIREIEQDLETWKTELPKEFDPANKDPNFGRAQYSLRATYAFNQMLLYRPFLHFVGGEKRASQTDQRAYACAASYINVSRNLIHLFQHSKVEGQLNGALWFIMYTSFFAILSLVYFAAENPDNPTTQDVMKDALIGKDMIKSMSNVAMAADRCSATLDAVFSKLPQWMREGKPNPQPKRKRKHAETKKLSEQTASMPRPLPPQIAVDQMTSSPASMSDPGMPTASTTLAGDSSLTPSYASGPYTPSGYSPTTQTMQQFGLQPQPSSDGGREDVPDFSGMLFTPGQPFNYPTQPLTAFEDHHQMLSASAQGKTHDMYTPASAAQAGMPFQQGTNHAGDVLGAQSYNLPHFMMQGGWATNQAQGFDGGAQQQAAHQHMMQQRQQHQQQFLVAQQQQGNGLPRGQWQGAPPPQQQQQQQQAAGPAGAMFNHEGFGDINLQEIFGSADWNAPLMSQGYGS